MNPNTTTEYRDLPLAVLTESTTNPRRIYDNSALKELAESIRIQGVLSPLLVRPLNEHGFEIVAGARRYRAAKMAEAETVPVRIVNPYTATDQAVIVQGTLVAPAVTPEVLAHPDTIIIFPLCWQACLFGSPLKFDKSYDRAHPQQPLN